jgi:acetylornithine/succinyldiaminopimelate/putrescine aminotransferase
LTSSLSQASFAKVIELVRSRWPSHTSSNTKPESPVEARRCTVQLSTGRLYLDAAATPATAILGHDLPQLAPSDEPTVRRMISSLAPGYTCVALAPGYASAADRAAHLARSLSASSSRVVRIHALNGEPPASPHPIDPDPNDLIVAYENETLARTGRWLASAAWPRPPAFIVIGEALALGSPFGAVLAREALATNLDLSQVVGDSPGAFLSADSSVLENSSTQPHERTADEALSSATLSRVAAAVRIVGKEGLLQHGRELAEYLTARLHAVRETCPQIESISSVGLFFRITLTPPLTASLIRRRMCERGVLVAIDDQSVLVINPPLALRIAEADVITGALRGALLDSPMPTASAPCSGCSS